MSKRYHSRSITESQYGRKMLALRRARRFPMSNLGWHEYYVRNFNSTQDEDSATLAMFYLFVALRDEETT